MTQPLTFPIAVDIVALTVIDHALHALVVRRGIEPFRNPAAPSSRSPIFSSHHPFGPHERGETPPAPSGTRWTRY